MDGLLTEWYHLLLPDRNQSLELEGIPSNQATLSHRSQPSTLSPHSLTPHQPAPCDPVPTSSLGISPTPKELLP